MHRRHIFFFTVLLSLLLPSASAQVPSRTEDAKLTAYGCARPPQSQRPTRSCGSRHDTLVPWRCLSRPSLSAP